MSIYTNIIYILIIINTYLFTSCFGVLPRFGHPYYKTIRLNDENICNPVNPLNVKKIELKKYAGSTSALSVSPGPETWTRLSRSDFECQFIVKAPKDEHLFASIQTISFRKNENECLDYVRFKRKDRDITPKICGDFRKKVPNYLRNENLLSQNFIFDNKDYNNSLNLGQFDLEGEIETTIFVSKQNIPKNYELDLVIVYTPYENCDKANADRTVSLLENNVCLSKDYICDSVENCNTLCTDEKYCPPEIMHNGNNSVTIGAVTTIMFLFTIFLMGLCLCKKNKCCCWSRDCAGPTQTGNSGGGGGGGGGGGSGNHQIAGSPMLEVNNGQQSTLDKDLPPSYDSLFPEQSN